MYHTVSLGLCKQLIMSRRINVTEPILVVLQPVIVIINNNNCVHSRQLIISDGTIKLANNIKE